MTVGTGSPMATQSMLTLCPTVMVMLLPGVKLMTGGAVQIGTNEISILIPLQEKVYSMLFVTKVLYIYDVMSFELVTDSLCLM